MLDVPRRLKMLPKSCFIELSVFISLVNLARNSFRSGVFANVILFVHKFDELLLVHVWFELLQDLLELWIVFILPVIGINPHVFLHFIVVASHELAHLIHHIVFTLSLDRLLIVFQLTSEQIGLGVLELDGLLLGLFLAGEAWH